MAYQFAQAGGVLSVNPVGLGGLLLIKKPWTFPKSRRDNQADRHDHYGDRKQMLVFIGQDMDEAAIQCFMLDDCLLGNALAEAEFEQWDGVEDPFPPLVLPEEER